MVQYKLSLVTSKKSIKKIKKMSKLFKLSNGIFLKKPITQVFKQYNRFFLKLKFYLKGIGRTHLKGRLSQFRLLPAKKHAKNIRMGKGASKFLGFV